MEAFKFKMAETNLMVAGGFNSEEALFHFSHNCWESTYFILHKLSNVWIPVTLTFCLISYTKRDYLNFNIAYFGVTI